MGQRGLFQRNEPLAQGFDVTQRLLVSPRPQVMLTWLFEGAQCGLRQNAFGKRNFKIMIIIILKVVQSMPFSSFSQPQ